MSNRRKFVLGAVIIALAAVAADYWLYTREMSGKTVFFSGAVVILIQFALTQVLGVALKVYEPKKDQKGDGVVEEKK